MVAIDSARRRRPTRRSAGEIAASLHRYRRIGHDLAVVAGAFRAARHRADASASLPGYLRGHVEAALLDRAQQPALPGRRLAGFFHPDNLTFGAGDRRQHAGRRGAGRAGVESVDVDRLRAPVRGADGELDNGLLPLGPLEIARLDNDPDFPENGRLTLEWRGGR